MSRLLTALLGVLLLAGNVAAQDLAAFKAKIKPFLERHCTDCHGPDVQKAGLRLDELKPDFADARTMSRWVHVHDKLVAGEMPPQKRKRPPRQDLELVTQWLHRELHAASLAKQEKHGRVLVRRLNGTEYENTLHDLLGRAVDVKVLLPEDSSVAGFDNVSAALDFSATHYLAYQEAAEKAILATIPYRPPGSFNEKRTGKEIVDKLPVFNEALGKSCRVKGDTLVLHARLPDHILCATVPVPQPGRYKVRVSAYAIGTQGKTLTLAFVSRPLSGRRSDPDQRVCRDVPADKPAILEAEFDLNRYGIVNVAGWSLPERYQFFISKPGPLDDYKGPGLVVEWLKIEGPFDVFPPASYERLFAGVPLKPRSVAKAEAEQRPVPKIKEPRGDSAWMYDPLVPASTKPKEDAERLIRDFVPRAFRRPVSEELTRQFVRQVHERLDKKYTFLEAMTFGYTAILTSPHFLFFMEPGAAELTPAKDFRSTRLDDYALAGRLAYFLWSSPPDQELLNLAEKNALAKPATLRAQVERMIKHAKSQRFTENFVGQWLDLRKINATTPDPQLYSEYDAFLFWSMPRETELFFEEVLRHDRSLLEFVHSDWSFLNERLARHYGIAGVEGHVLRKVTLPAARHRGGVITQASVLKVTADGTRTSPVLRGKWVLERIVGKPPAPPPPDIPSIEPDIRGATTIREQLDKHRNTPACASCHVHIDPPGFALETYDAIGGWRDFYRATRPTKKGIIKGQRYFRGPDVEKGGLTPDGRPFKDIDDYKKILLEDKDQLARNLTEKLVVYATGAEIQFADREVVERIVTAVRERNYGFRTLIHEVVQSRVFLSK